MKKRVLAFALIMVLLLSLVGCGKKNKSISDEIKDSMKTDLFNLAAPADLREFDCKEESDGLYVVCLAKYANTWFVFSEFSLHPYLHDLFEQYPEITSLLMVFQGIEDGHVYNCLYVRDGNSYEIVDEIEVQ